MSKLTITIETTGDRHDSPLAATFTGGRHGTHAVEGNEARIVAHARGYWEANGRKATSGERAAVQALRSCTFCGRLAAAGVMIEEGNWTHVGCLKEANGGW